MGLCSGGRSELDDLETFVFHSKDIQGSGVIMGIQAVATSVERTEL